MAMRMGKHTGHLEEHMERDAHADDKDGPDSAELNATLHYHDPPRGRRPGAAGRDAGEGAGVESGLAHKETFADSDCGCDLLGKHIEPMGTPPWAGPPEETVDGTVEGTFGAGERHVIKNG